ncbi:MAG: hypothetical protein HY805_06260 [Nitrospirae bacterium]|nr:hypothetical protein [Nitrospirota bacterium]
MIETPNICAVCAWRATCQKKFSISGKNIRCPDFVKDASLDIDSKAKEPEKTDSQKEK